MRGIDIEDARAGIGDHGSRDGGEAADRRRIADRRLRNSDDQSFDHPWRRSRRDRRYSKQEHPNRAVAECDHRSAKPNDADASGARTLAIHALCERNAGTQRCFFPACDGCGFDQIIDREAAANRRKIATREFVPDDRQRAVNLAIHATLGNVCATPENAVALLTYSLSEYIGKVCKPEFRTEAFLTVIHCLRINAGMDDESKISG